MKSNTYGWEKDIVATIRIMLVDDYRQWRVTLRSMLEAIDGFRVIAEAANGLEAVEQAAQSLPDIVLLDVSMPVMNGIEAAPRIRRASPGSSIIFLSQDQDADVRTAALATGAQAYLPKSTPIAELASTIRSVLMSQFADSAPTASFHHIQPVSP